VNTDTGSGFLNGATLAGSVAFIALFTTLSGLGDAQGFVYAGKVRRDGRFYRSGRAFRWSVDQGVAPVVLLGIGWLLYRDARPT
jgi:hypothetical protein